MATEPRNAKRPLRTLARALCALALILSGATAQAQLGIIGPSAPAPEYILIAPGHGASACAASTPPSVYERSGRRGQEGNPSVPQIDPRTGSPCPPK
jgi:hypothetical protein